MFPGSRAGITHMVYVRDFFGQCGSNHSVPRGPEFGVGQPKLSEPHDLLPVSKRLLQLERVGMDLIETEKNKCEASAKPYLPA